jgi:hypothetical protein
MSRRFLVLTAALAGLALPTSLLPAQEQPTQPPQGENRGGDRDRGGDRGGRGGGGGGFEQFRERYISELKTEMGVTEEEWKVIQPKLDKVMEARREMGGGFGRGGRGGGGGGGGGGGDGDRQRSAVETASRELRDLLENKDAPADEIKAKLAALRDAREKARANLLAAQKELKEILSQRQEAVLVARGTLE